MSPLTWKNEHPDSGEIIGRGLCITPKQWETLAETVALMLPNGVEVFLFIRERDGIMKVRAGDAGYNIESDGQIT